METKDCRRGPPASFTKSSTLPTKCSLQQLGGKEASAGLNAMPMRLAGTPAKKRQSHIALQSKLSHMHMQSGTQPVKKIGGFRLKERHSIRLGSAPFVTPLITNGTPLLHQRETWEFLHNILDQIRDRTNEKPAKERVCKTPQPKGLGPRGQRHSGGKPRCSSTRHKSSDDKKGLMNLLKPFFSLVEVEPAGQTATVLSPPRSSLHERNSGAGHSIQKIRPRTVSFRLHTPSKGKPQNAKKLSTSAELHMTSSPQPTHCPTKVRSQTVLKAANHMRPTEEAPLLTGEAFNGFSYTNGNSEENLKRGHNIQRHFSKTTGPTHVGTNSHSGLKNVVGQTGVCSRLPQGAMARRKSRTVGQANLRTKTSQVVANSRESDAFDASLKAPFPASSATNREASDDSDRTVNYLTAASKRSTGKVHHVFLTPHTLETTPPSSDSACSAEKPSSPIRKIRQPGTSADGERSSSSRNRNNSAFEPHEVEAPRRSTVAKPSGRSSSVNPAVLAQHDRNAGQSKSAYLRETNVRRSGSAHRLENRMPQQAASPKQVASPRNFSKMLPSPHLTKESSSASSTSNFRFSQDQSNADILNDEMNILKVNSQLSEMQPDKHAKPRRASKIPIRQGRNQAVASSVDDARDSSTHSSLPSTTRRQSALSASKDLAGRFTSLAPPNRQVQPKKASQLVKPPQGKRRPSKVLPKGHKNGRKSETVSPADDAVKTAETESDPQPAGDSSQTAVETPRYLTLNELPRLDEPIRSMICDVDSLTLETDSPRAPEVDEVIAHSESTELTHILRRCGTLSSSSREAATRNAVSLLARNGPGTLQLVARWMDTAASSVNNDKSRLEDKLSWREIVPPFFVESDIHTDLFTQSPHKATFSLQDLRTFFHEEGFVETGIAKLRRVVRKLTAAKAFGESQNAKGLWDETTDLSAKTRARWASEYLDYVLSVSVEKLRLYRTPQIFPRVLAKRTSRGLQSCGLYRCSQKHKAGNDVASYLEPYRGSCNADAVTPRSQSACRGLQTLFGKYNSEPCSSFYETFQACRRSHSAFPRISTRQTFRCGASLKRVFCGSNYQEDGCEDEGTREVRAIVGNMSVLPSEAYLYYLRQNCEMERLVKIAVWLVGNRAALLTYRQFVARKLQRVAAMRMLYLVKRRKMTPTSQTKLCGNVRTAAAPDEMQTSSKQGTQSHYAESTGNQSEVPCEDTHLGSHGGTQTVYTSVGGLSCNSARHGYDPSTKCFKKATPGVDLIKADPLVERQSFAHLGGSPDPETLISLIDGVNQKPKSVIATSPSSECTKTYQVRPSCFLRERNEESPKHPSNTRIRRGHLNSPLSRTSTAEMTQRRQTLSRQTKKPTMKTTQNEPKEATLRRSQSNIPRRSMHAERSTRSTDTVKSGHILHHKGQLKTYASLSLRSPQPRVLTRSASSAFIKKERAFGYNSAAVHVLSESQLLQEVRKLCQRLRSLNCCQHGCDESTPRAVSTGVHTPPSEVQDTVGRKV